MEKGIIIIKKERLEHSTKHKRNVLYDVQHNASGQLRRAARKLLVDDPSKLHDHPPKGWNKTIWVKMCKQPYINRIAIAASLIAAEIDRVNYCIENNLKTEI